jgi:acetyltransferase-like isoleucine patch superfamily enzyme
MKKIYYKFLKVWWKISVPIRMKLNGVVLGKNVVFLGVPIVDKVKGSEIIIGDRVVLCSDSRFTALGVNHPVILKTMAGGAKIVIKNDVGLSGSSICSMKYVEIGSHCLLGANTTIVDTDFHSLDPINRRYNNDCNSIKSSPTFVGNNVFLGMGAIVLKGVKIGDGSVVGAGAVISKNLPHNSISVGNPSRVVSIIS